MSIDMTITQFTIISSTFGIASESIEFQELGEDAHKAYLIYNIVFLFFFILDFFFRDMYGLQNSKTAG